MKTYLTLLALLILANPTIAAARVAILGGVDYSLYSNSLTIGTASVDIKGGLGFGGGLLMDFGKFELGAIYRTFVINTTTTISSTSITASTSTSLLEIPAMYRFGSGNTTFGLGGFYDLVMSSGGGSNYGFTAGPRFSSAGGLFLDLRFNYALKTDSSKDVIAMIGYYFGK